MARRKRHRRNTARSNSDPFSSLFRWISSIFQHFFPSPARVALITNKPMQRQKPVRQHVKPIETQEKSSSDSDTDTDADADADADEAFFDSNNRFAMLSTQHLYPKPKKEPAKAPIVTFEMLHHEKEIAEEMMQACHESKVKLHETAQTLFYVREEITDIRAQIEAMEHKLIACNLSGGSL